MNNNSDGEDFDSEGAADESGKQGTNADGVVTKRRDFLKAATLSSLDTAKIETNRSSSPRLAGDDNLPNNNIKVSFQMNQSGKPTATSNNTANRHSNPASYSKTPSQNGGVDVLLIVVHGGNVTCTDTSKQSDFINFKTTLDNIIKTNNGGFASRVAFRLVTCEPICKDALIKLAT
jgi:hypothetical protein